MLVDVVCVGCTLVVCGVGITVIVIGGSLGCVLLHALTPSIITIAAPAMNFPRIFMPLTSLLVTIG